MNINVTLFYQMIFFVLFVWFSKKFVWSPIIGAIHARKTTIADGLAAAENGQQAAKEGRKQAEQFVSEAKVKASKIIDNAEKRGTAIVEKAKSAAQEECALILNSSRNEIEIELNKAKESLRGQIGELVVAGAQQILKREIDAKAHIDLLNKLAAKL